MDPWEDAVQQLEKSLSSEEREFLKNSNPSDVLSDIAKLENAQRKSSKLRRATARIQPLINTISDYGRALDVFANSSEILSPLWASLRILILTAQRYSDYYARLIDMLERIGDVIPRFATYARLLSAHVPLQQALQSAFRQMVLFVVQARKTLRRSSALMMMRTTWTSFDREFEDFIVRFRGDRERVEGEARLAGLIEQMREGERAEGERVRAAESRRRIEGLERVAEDQSKEASRRWLGARKCSQERAGIEQSRIPSSCEWVLEREEFQSWVQQSDKQLFWLHGAPGCGKSYLYSKILEYLEKDKPATYFLFCGGDKERVTVLSLLRSWCLQLIEFNPELLCCLEAAKANSTNPTAAEKEVVALLQLLLDRASSCYLTVDALDECNDRDQFFKYIALIPKRFKVFIIGRTNIRKCLLRIQTPLHALEIQPEYSRDDIHAFITASLENGEIDWSHHTRNMVRDRLAQCDGMFLWVKLMMEHLQSQTCEHDVLHSLKALPEGLPETYERILQRISKLPTARRLLAYQVFFWGITVRRPVTVNEIRVLIAIEPDSDVFNEQKLISDAENIILEVCGGLIQYRGSDRKIFFAHFSVTEYLEQFLDRRDIRQATLERYGALSVQSNDGIAAAVCLRYLCYNFLATLPIPHDHAEAASLPCKDSTRLALLPYAASHWTTHLSAIQPHEPFDDALALHFLHQSPNLAFWWRLHWFSTLQPTPPSDYPARFSGLHVAAYFGLSRWIPPLVCLARGPSLGDSSRRSPLWWAAARGHVEAARLLVEAGLDSEAADEYAITPALVAAASGHVGVVEVLALRKGGLLCDGPGDGKGWSPMLWLSLGASRGTRFGIGTSEDDGRDGRLLVEYEANNEQDGLNACL